MGAGRIPLGITTPWTQVTHLLGVLEPTAAIQLASSLHPPGWEHERGPRTVGIALGGADGVALGQAGCWHLLSC